MCCVCVWGMSALMPSMDIYVWLCTDMTYVCALAYAHHVVYVSMPLCLYVHGSYCIMGKRRLENMKGH